MGSFSYLHVIMTYMRAWMSSKFGQIRPLVSMATEGYNGKNDVTTFSRLIFIRSFSYLQTIMICMRTRRSSKFGEIRPPTAELAALECLKKNLHRLIMGKQCFHFFSAIVDQMIFIFVSTFSLFCAFTRPRYQVSVYKTNGLLV